MDLKEYSMEELILTAIKSERDANDIYSRLSRGVKNAILKDRLRFLAAEEQKHEAFVVELFHRQFPGRDVVLPESSPVPMPHVEIPAEHVPVSHIIKDAMRAERSAAQFYSAFAKRYTQDKEIRDMLNYFAAMESMHYEMLEKEKATADRFESYDDMWPMMHAGP